MSLQLTEDDLKQTISLFMGDAVKFALPLYIDDYIKEMYVQEIHDLSGLGEKK